MVVLFRKTISQLDETVDGSLPNIVGTFPMIEDYDYSKQSYRSENLSGVFYRDAVNVSSGYIDQKLLKLDQDRAGFNASRSSEVYNGVAGDSIVRPTSIGVCMWKRTL